jgi:signal transduction histidine kinase
MTAGTRSAPSEPMVSDGGEALSVPRVATWIPLSLVVAALLSLATVPFLTYRRIDRLRHRISGEVVPARSDVSRLELALAREAASIRAYAISPEPQYLAGFESADQDEAQAARELEPLIRGLGPQVRAQFDQLAPKNRRWLRSVEDIRSGLRPPDRSGNWLELQQTAFEDLLDEAADVDGALADAEGSLTGEVARAERLQAVTLPAVATMALAAALSVGWLGRRQRALAAALRRRAEEFHVAVRTRDQVLAVVSHDLRSPLNTITVAAAGLPGAEDTSRREALARVIARASVRMKGLIHDLLDVARLEAGGQLAMELTVVNVVAVMNETEEAFAPQAVAQSKHLELDAPGAMPGVRADRGRLLQALANLVDNALKFTPEDGQVTLRARLEGRTVALEVRDSGPGIPETDLPRIFDPYWQGGRSPRAGAGLGLAITRAIVEAHGGTLTVESYPGLGAAFRFSLPVAE